MIALWMASKGSSVVFLNAIHFKPQRHTPFGAGGRFGEGLDGLKREVDAVFLAEQLGYLTPGFPGSSPAWYATGLGFFIIQFGPPAPAD